MLVSDLCVRNVATVHKDSILMKAIDVMQVYDVDNVVVVEYKDNSNFPVGILTDQDIVRRATSRGLSPIDVRVKDVMTKNLITCNEEDGIFETISRMQKGAVKHLPVVDEDGVLTGIVSNTDLYNMLSEELLALSAKSHPSFVGHRLSTVMLQLAHK